MLEICIGNSNVNEELQNQIMTLSTKFNYAYEAVWLLLCHNVLGTIWADP